MTTNNKNTLLGDYEILNLDYDGSVGEEFQLGKLSSTNRIQLNTRQAINLYNGQQSKNSRAMSFGIRQAAYNLNMMMISIRNNDPYGDYYFCDVEDRISLNRNLLNQSYDYYLQRATDQIPAGFAMSKSLSLNPLKIEIRSSNPLFFQMVFWLCKLDEFVSLISSLKHLGIIKPTDASNIIEETVKPFRSLTHFIRSYKITGVTRDDIAANNQRAIQAKEKMQGITLPTEILTGEYRSDFAPEVIKEDTVEVIGVKNIAQAEPTKSEQSSPESPDATINDELNIASTDSKAADTEIEDSETVL